MLPVSHVWSSVWPWSLMAFMACPVLLSLVFALRSPERRRIVIWTGVAVALASCGVGAQIINNPDWCEKMGGWWYVIIGCWLP